MKIAIENLRVGDVARFPNMNKAYKVLNITQLPCDFMRLRLQQSDGSITEGSWRKVTNVELIEPLTPEEKKSVKDWMDTGARYPEKLE